MYLSDCEGTSDAADLDDMLNDEIFATVMGQRMLAVSGYDVDDSLLSLRQMMLDGMSDSAADEFLARHSRRFDVYRRKGRSYMMPRVRDWHLLAAESDTAYNMLPGGYIAAVQATRSCDADDDGNLLVDITTENDMNELSSDDMEDLDVDNDDNAWDELHDEDEDYMDYIGSQLLMRRAKAPLWVIDVVQEQPDSDHLVYSLTEACASDLLTTADDDMSEDDEDCEYEAIEDHGMPETMATIMLGRSPNQRPRKTVRVFHP